MQAMSQTTQSNVQTEVKSAEAAAVNAKVELSAVQLALVGGGSGNLLFM
jgi:hypothetical protein